ncbi:MAG: hypothetical protein ACKVT0_21895 [Planctomycetaceae bacterium]
MPGKRHTSIRSASAGSPPKTARGLLAEIEQLFPELIDALQELLTHYELKSSAMKSASATQMLQLADAETTHSQRLERGLAKRRLILKEAAQLRLPHKTLRELIDALPDAPVEKLRSQLLLVQQMSQQLRLAGWSHWVIAHRAQAFYTDMIELIAHGGHRPPTYSQHPQREGNGGVLLDTSI